VKGWRIGVLGAVAAAAAAGVLVVTAVLYLGPGLPDRSPPDLEAQVRALASELRCLQCQGLSAWDSNTASSLQMRAEIREMLEQGLTRAEIIQVYVDRYGPWVLIRPPLRGFGLLAYLIPAAGLLVGVVVLRRLLRAGRAAPPDVRGPERGIPASGRAAPVQAGEGGASHALIDEALRRYEQRDR